MADEDDDLVLRKYFGVHDKSLRELYTSTSSDATFYKLAEKIERRAAKSGKTVKHRVECWLRKLCQQVRGDGPVARATPREAPQTHRIQLSLSHLFFLARGSRQTSNYDWKKNRNHYATLLLEMLESGKLEFPFDKRPEEGPLKTLPTYLRPFASGGVVRAEKPKQTSRPESARRRADKAEDVVNIASAAVDVLHEHNVSRSAASEADGSGFGYRYDAEIQLGACRERCLELEMQVNAKNDQIDRLERKLAKARKAHEVDVQRYRGKVSSPFNACVFVVDFG